ncbi:putative hydrolase, alpha/beta fold protein [Mycobacterium antarcticum]|uniref:alpha/beta hydrolase n=1 Tax=Mycolicibacterium sp. TUM20985 TaxID=3023370 RepID=UPI002572B99E|nr:alpha/beta hydrolase [Mycolicibacterium sp. TUM20985]BDX33677.1 putative hydrolase, alpha/beta fold protein [Mycolicibacterium sp. TUM20985]
MSRTAMTIDADGEGRLAADFTAASDDALDGPRGRPCVVMAHGFTGTRDCGLDGFIDVLTAAGAHVLAFDYRHFGQSSGIPDQLVSPARQIRYYHAAIHHARALPGVDPYRIAVWGVSLSGGHVMRVAAEDRRLAAVVSLTPGIDGGAAVALMLRTRGLRDPMRVVGRAAADVAAAALGRPPVLTPAIGRPGDAAAITPPGALEAMTTIAGPMWRNEFPARGLLAVGAYRPASKAGRIRCPVLMQIADHDQVAPAHSARRIAERIGASTQHYPCDHFDVYTGMAFHEQVAAHQVEFLRRVLSSPTDQKDRS